MNLMTTLFFRYLRQARGKRSLSLMLVLCFISILIGAWALALVQGVMGGFEHALYTRLQSIHAPITIASFTKKINTQALTEVLNKEFPAIISISPRNSNHAIIQDPDTDDVQVLMVKAFDPQIETTISSLCTTLDNDNLTLSEILTHNRVIIGKKLAQTYGLQKGDPLKMYYSTGSVRGNKLKLKETNVIIGGLFQTGIDDFDRSLIFMSLQLFDTLWRDAGINELGIAYDTTKVREADLLAALRNRIALDIHSWKELYPALVSAITLEKYAMTLILILITLVASMNIIALLFMLITQKKGDIAILRAMGHSASSLQKLFIGIGMSIATLAACAGLICAYITQLIVQFYPISLPDVYCVQTLPVHITAHHALFVLAVVLVLSFLASFIASRTLSTIDLASIIKYER